MMRPPTDVLDRLAPLFPPPDRSVETVFRRRDRRQRNQRLGAAVLASAVAVAAIAGVLHAFGSGADQPAVEGSTIIDWVPIDRAGEVEVGAGGVWVVGAAGISRVDPATDSVTDTLTVPGGGSDLRFSGGSLWVSNSAQGITRIDPGTGQIGTLPFRDATDAVVVAGSLWVTDYGRGSVSRVDLQTGDVLATVPVGAPDAASLAVAGGDVWVTVDDGGVVTRIDPRTDMLVASARVDGSPGAIAATSDAVWVATTDHTATAYNGIERIDLVSNHVSRVLELPQSAQAQAVAVDGRSLWVAVTDFGRTGLKDPNGPITGSIVQIDASTGSVIRTIPLGTDVYDLAVGNGAVWATSTTSGELLRIELTA